MSDKYKISEEQDPYFVTFTITNWIKVLADDSFKMIVVDSIKYCQQHKGLLVYAYCIMPNHVHMIVQSNVNNSMSEILRDLKTFASRAIAKKPGEEKSVVSTEMLTKFAEAGKPLKHIKKHKVWQDGNHAELLYGNRFIQEKLKYIHRNPVKYGLCEEEWDYKFSSATNYTDIQSLKVCGSMHTRCKRARSEVSFRKN